MKDGTDMSVHRGKVLILDSLVKVREENEDIHEGIVSNDTVTGLSKAFVRGLISVNFKDIGSELPDTTLDMVTDSVFKLCEKELMKSVGEAYQKVAAKITKG